MLNHSSVYNKVSHCWTHRSADVHEYLKQTLCNEHVPTIRHESSSRSWSEDTKITWVNVLILIPNWFVMLTVSWCVAVSLLTQIPQQSACQQPIMYLYTLTVWLTVSLQLWVEKNQNVPYPWRESVGEEEASVLTLLCQPWLFLVASVVLWMAFWVSSVTFPLTCPLYHVHCMHIHIQQQPIACIWQTAGYTHIVDSPMWSAVQCWPVTALQSSCFGCCLVKEPT